jgi:isopenicillin-N N-acyltransferase-like protein
MCRARLMWSLSALLLFVAAPVAAQLHNYGPRSQPGHERVYPEGKHKQGELKYVNGIPILIVQGTPEEMGEQAGVLTVKPLKHLVSFAERFKKEFGVERIWPVLAPLCRGMVKQFPAHHLAEFEAFVKHNGIDRDLAIVGQLLGDAKHFGGCSTLVVQADRSATGAPLFGRNTDLPSVGVLDKYVLVTVYRAKGKRAFASVSYPGMIGCSVGINDAGLALTMNDAYSSKDDSPLFDPRGVPSGFLYRRVLEECATVEEAEKRVRASSRASLHILTLCDAKDAVVLEVTTRNVVARRPDKGLVAGTNHFRSDELSTHKKCRRYATFEKALAQPKFTLADVHKQMDAVNQGAYTVQTMVFEPASLKLHLAFGSTPSSALPLRELDLGLLFRTVAGAESSQTRSKAP